MKQKRGFDILDEIRRINRSLGLQRKCSCVTVLRMNKATNVNK